MTIQPIGETMRGLIGGARKAAGSQSGMSQTDRTLAALTLVGVAVVVAWPRHRPVPKVASKAGQLGKYVWDRRSWWIG
jgi:hypothetical protein